MQSFSFPPRQAISIHGLRYGSTGCLNIFPMIQETQQRVIINRHVICDYFPMYQNSIITKLQRKAVNAV